MSWKGVISLRRKGTVKLSAAASGNMTWKKLRNDFKNREKTLHNMNFILTRDGMEAFPMAVLAWVWNGLLNGFADWTISKMPFPSLERWKGINHKYKA